HTRCLSDWSSDVCSSDLASACLTVCDAASIGLVIVAETAGVIGASLRRSPVEVPAGGDFFAHPAVRTRLTFTAERAFMRTVTLRSEERRVGRAGRSRWWG